MRLTSLGGSPRITPEETKPEVNLKMNSEKQKRPPDPFGDDEGILDIHCRPALPQDIPQIASLVVDLLNKLFGPTVGDGGREALDVVQSALRVRLRHDCTWVMIEGDTVIGVIDVETTETRRLNGPPLPRILSDSLGYTERVRDAGLLPLLLHEPASDEAHQPIVSLLAGSRGEGRGTLLLMHGAFWARAQGKNWITTWLPAADPVLQVYERRGYFVEQEVESTGAAGSQKWLFLKKPISSLSYKIMRQREKQKSL